MRLFERLNFLLGLILIGFGFIVTAGSVLTFFKPDGKYTIVESIIMTTLLGIVPMIVGFILCKKMRMSGKDRESEKLEREVLQLAKKNEGRLTVAELSMQMEISSTKAKSLLENCHLNSLADISVTDNGVVEYQFKF